jgi:alcohol dehydrogenase
MGGIKDLTIFFPGKLIFGCGKLSQLGEEISKLKAKKVLIITIEPILKSLYPLIEYVSSQGLEIKIDTSITQEPYFSHFNQLIKDTSPFDPDLVIGIGGGSVLDISKLVAAQLRNDQQLKDYVGTGLLNERKTKLICLPATAGTGSEVSPNAILVDDEDGQKKAVISPFLVPDVVIVDPFLTMSVPPNITAATGIDALTHCLEAFTNRFAHPMIDLYAFEGMRLIANNIVEAVLRGWNEEARTAVALGSLYGGYCLGPVNTAGVHALSYPLGSMFHLPHGLSNALLLPYVMEYNLSADPDRYAGVARALGCEEQIDKTAMSLAGVNKIKKLILDCRLPLRLRDAGVEYNAIPQMAEAAMKIQRLLKNNPRELILENVITIYNSAY